jgi:hypothetical protein
MALIIRILSRLLKKVFGALRTGSWSQQNTEQSHLPCFSSVTEPFSYGRGEMVPSFSAAAGFVSGQNFHLDGDSYPALI